MTPDAWIDSSGSPQAQQKIHFDQGAIIFPLYRFGNSFPSNIDTKKTFFRNLQNDH